ncbi:MAG: hypothetical protein J6A68_01370, partial [Oscillospiraceae bacterium]|nr:hypothetical protein [Oscillospiraceae bacterium]
PFAGLLCNLNKKIPKNMIAFPFWRKNFTKSSPLAGNLRQKPIAPLPLAVLSYLRSSDFSEKFFKQGTRAIFYQRSECTHENLSLRSH